MSQAELELNALFEHIRATSKSETEKGHAYALIIRDFLRNDSEFKDLYEEVLLWVDFTLKYGGKQNDTGIDLVAKDKDGHFTAIQCKFYKEAYSLKMDDLNSFFTKAGTKHIGKYKFTYKMIATTTSKFAPNLTQHIEDENKEEEIIKVVSKEKLIFSNINWNTYLNQDEIEIRERFTPKKHQKKAIDKAVNGFKTSDRGKLIMACGTGKTLTGLRLIEELFKKKNALVLIAMPSIALISQTIREYCHQAWDDDIYPIAVCSQKIQKEAGEDEDGPLTSLVHPSTTQPREIADLVANTPKDKRCIIFTTYQSMDKVMIAQQECGLPEFDFIIADEAHRTAGINRQMETTFTLIHKDEHIKGKKRLYMTATPRIFSLAAERRAEGDNAKIYSMNDKKIFGDLFYELSFGRAVNDKLLSDYKVLVTVVDNKTALDSMVILDDKEKKGMKTIDAAKFIGIHKAIAKKDLLRAIELQGAEDIPDSQKWEVNDTEPMKRVINFSPSIQSSKRVAQYFPKFKEPSEVSLEVGIQHIDGTMNSYKREHLMQYLTEENPNEDCRMLTNAKCLTEGVDIPALDGICFYSKKKSFIDIVQAVGRVLRKSPGKEYGYIILPVCIGSDEITDVASAVRNNPDFEIIWQVISALKAHDKALVDEGDYRRKIKVLDFTGSESNGGEKVAEEVGEQIELPLAEEIFNAIADIYGESAFWGHWGEEVNNVYERVKERLIHTVENDKVTKERFNDLLSSFQKNIQHGITEEMLFQTLAQHLVTEPIFSALFTEGNFVKDNIIARALGNFLDDVKKISGIEEDLSELDMAYESMNRSLKDKPKEKRAEIIEGLYNSFLKAAFPDLVSRLGIVYTPDECVDFILKSTEDLLHKHFGHSISGNDVNILDPFTGTGTFIRRLLDKDLNLIKDENLLHKYQNEIHANEIVLLAYYIALLNIEYAFNIRHGGDYVGFQNAVYGDTFDTITQKELKSDTMKEAGKKKEAQDKKDITIIVSNPPYSAGRRSAMEGNQNVEHEKLNKDIKNTYAKFSNANNKRQLRDSYIKAIRWSTDRIGERGIVSFVVNGSFIDDMSKDGVRACLGKDLSHIYIVDLKGRLKGLAPTERDRQGGNIFNITVPVAIAFFIKDGTQVNRDSDEIADIQYYEIENDITGEEKKAFLEETGSALNLNAWEKIIPDHANSWINQGNVSYQKYIKIGAKRSNQPTIFDSRYSLGIATARGFWMYNYSEETLIEKMKLHIDTFNSYKNLDDINDRAKIKKSRGLLGLKSKGAILEFDKSKITTAMPNAFGKKNLYYEQQLVEMRYKVRHVYPKNSGENITICTSDGNFSAIACNLITDLSMCYNQCYPLYWYPEGEQVKNLEHDNYAISDWALKLFQGHYGKRAITKLDIFNFIYGLFHSSEYSTLFANDLRKDLPRIPLLKHYKDFKIFADAGKKLIDIHLNYESAKPYEVEERIIRKDLYDDKTSSEKELYRVTKMKFGKGKDKSIIIYNDFVSIENIPLKAYEYRVCNKSAIEWIMANYQYEPLEKENIIQDPNEYSDDPKYILNLLKSIITVSVDTMDIVDKLPKLDIDEESEFYPQATKF